MQRLAIIADDLTGASDSAAQLARHGLEAVVVLDPERHDALPRTDVVVLDTDSRALPPGEAYERVAVAARRLEGAGYARIYKKLDSTLRGNLGAELDAAMDVLGRELAVVAPAFPANGRTTRDGRHLLHGIPVSDAEPGRDPRAPVRESNVVKLLEGQSRRRAGLVPLAAVRAGPAAILARAAELRGRGVQLIVFDVETDGDLLAVAGAMLGAGESALWAGSAGLAAALASVWGPPTGAPPPPRPARPPGPVLLVSGSRSEATREQLRMYRAEPRVGAVELNPAAVLTSRASEVDRCAADLSALLLSGRDAALVLSSWRGEGDGGGSHRLADALGEAAARALRTCYARGVILTGGDTARAVCARLGVRGLRILDELEPGVPVSELLGAGGLLAVTKAGAFGEPHTLARALRTLKQQ